MGEVQSANCFLRMLSRLLQSDSDGMSFSILLWSSLSLEADCWPQDGTIRSTQEVWSWQDDGKSCAGLPPSLLPSSTVWARALRSLLRARTTPIVARNF